MHHILFSIVLNLSKENIDYIKLADAKKVSAPKTTVAEKIPTVTVDNLPDSAIMLDPGFMNADENFTAPYVTSDNFADLLPEDEYGNVVYENEVQGPTVMDNIKNKLIQITEKKEPAAVVIGSQVQGPTLRTPKEEPKKSAIVASEDVGPSFVDNISNKITTEPKPAQPAKPTQQKPGVVVGNSVQGPNLISRIRDKTAEATGKIKSVLPGADKKEEEKEETFERLPIVGTLFDSEYNQALKGKKPLDYNEYLRENRLLDLGEVSYEDTDEYKKFLEEKEIDLLVKSEKIIVPNIKPREKELLTYKTQEVPEELLEDRSFQNRHIPKILQNSDREKLLEKIIEYGMITEFRAFMNNLRDSNLVMENQYTLLTYAVKYKQYEIMKYLIHIGADVNKRDDRLDTPLIVAVYNNDLEAVRILMNANANPNKVDVLRRTPLVYCIEKNQEPIGVYLIDHGADVNITNGAGEGTLAMSIRLGRNIIKERILDALRKK